MTEMLSETHLDSRSTGHTGQMPALEPEMFVAQSRFFTPAFNAAIFDGPIRIYFAQHQEAQALKLYFNLQERFGDVRKQARGIFKERGTNIFVMIYPTEELFAESFSEVGAESDAVGTMIVRDRLGRDFVLGVRGPLEDEDFSAVCREMDLIVNASITASSNTSVIG